MRDEHARLRQPLQLGFADAEFAENRDIMFALKCRRSDRRQLICGKPPWPARQPILSAASIRHELHSAPVVAPLGRGQLLDRADFAHCDLGLVELGIERSQDGNVRLPMMLVATVNCSPCGPVKNEQSVAPSTAGSAPISSSDRSTWARSLTASKVAAIATSIYWPRLVFWRLFSAARMAITACKPA